MRQPNNMVSAVQALISSFSNSHRSVSKEEIQESIIFEQIFESLRCDQSSNYVSSISSSIDSSSEIEEIILGDDCNPDLSKFHLFLDIDGTLLHTVALKDKFIAEEVAFEDEGLQLASYKRPGIDNFLLFCFNTFASVSLWTAGTQSYANFVASNLAPRGRSFLFIMSRDHCKPHPFVTTSLVKDMNDVWFSDYGQTFSISKENSFIIDDNEAYCTCNPENAIIINTWTSLVDNDDTCSRLVEHFRQSKVQRAKDLCFPQTLFGNLEVV